MKRLTARVGKNLSVTWTDIEGKIHHGKIYEIETDEIHVRENNGTEHAWDLTRFLGKTL